MTVHIRAENLGKRYDLVRAVGSGLRKELFRRLHPSRPDDSGLWALRDLTFTVDEGESVGIIGSNGAGKSTLLKILSRVTKPTRGHLKIQGSFGALIELGAGFHPELSGRENIFLCGSILGMKKKEILARLDEIIAFSELERFIDMPVKRYSSGMFLRLGFSIAAHVYPDILLLDEVLSVGDLAFQKKCFDWLHRSLDSRRIVFLVSHQMHNIENLCHRVLYLDKGRIVFDGPADRAIALYLNDLGDRTAQESGAVCGERRRAGAFDVSAVSLRDEQDRPTDTVVLDTPLTIRIDYEAPFPVRRPKVEIALNCGGRRIGQANTTSDGTAPESLSGRGSLRFHWPRCFLTPNPYTVDVYISDGETMADLLVWRNCLSFPVQAPSGFRIASGEPGFLKIPGEWSCE